MIKPLLLLLAGLAPFAAGDPWLSNVRDKNLKEITAKYGDAATPDGDHMVMIEEAEGRPELTLYGYDGFGKAGGTEPCNSIQLTVAVQQKGVAAGIKEAGLVGVTTTKVAVGGADREVYALKGGPLGADWIGTIEALDEEDGFNYWFISLFTSEKSGPLTTSQKVDLSKLSGGFVSLAGKTFTEVSKLIGPAYDYLDSGSEPSTFYYLGSGDESFIVEVNTAKKDWRNKADIESFVFVSETPLTFDELMKKVGLGGVGAKVGEKEAIEGDVIIEVAGVKLPEGYQLYIVGKEGEDRYETLVLMKEMEMQR